MGYAFNPFTGKLDNTGPAPVTDHGGLSGLLDDDHTQYALLAGRATPQQFNFGTASGASTGYLSSTSHATKGKYFLNAAGTITVDDANVRLGINTASPATALDLGTASTTTTGIGWRSGSLYLYSSTASTLDTNANFQTTGTSADSATAGSGAIWRQNDGTALQSGNRLGFNLFSATDNGSTFRNAAGFNAYAASDWSSGVYPAYLNIETSDGTGARTERFRVGGGVGVGIVVNENALDNDSRFEGTTDANLLYTDAGNNRVGIGTATPSAKLDVQGDQLLTGTLYGDTANNGTLILRGTTQTTYANLGRTDIDRITLFSDSPTVTASTGHLIRTNGTITLDYTSAGVNSMVMFDPTIYQKQSTTLFTATLFNMNAVVQNEPTTSGITIGSLGAFVGQPQIKADTYDTRLEKQWTFLERSIFGAGSGTAELYTPQWYRFYAANQLLGNVRTGGRVLTHVAFYAEQPTLAGTGILHNNYAISGTTQTVGRDFNYFIYNRGGLIYTADDIEVDSLGTDGLVLHDTGDTRYRYTTKAKTGALQTAEVAFDPFVDIDWQFATSAVTGNVGGVADLADVTRWNDKSGNGRDLVLGAGTSNPRWENSLAAHNSQPAVEFTAANSDSLEMTTSAAAISLSDYTIVALVSFKTVAAAQRILGHATSSTNRGFGITATPNWTTQMGATAASAGTPATGTAYFVRIRATASAHTIYVDETLIATTATAATAMNQIVLGAGKSSAPAYANYADMYLSWIGVYNGDLSNDDQYQRFLEYMNTTYGKSLTTTSVAQGTNTHTLTTNSNITAVGNVGAGEDDLMTYTLPASFLSADGDSMSFEAAGTIANTANNKRIRIKFGATTILDTGAAAITTSTAFDWVARGRVVRTGAATQDAYAEIRLGSTLYWTDFTSPAETLSGAITFKFTGEATANNDVVQELMINKVDGS